ncbi:glycosyltransferase family 2 protein [Blautia hydrogenotrophica]|uniref:glycosyltransferase family 2 protein n=1 Tax=Blautia hydrogenotrophica TaxID=53443 RepID=UPI002E781940|nr:glycosyltransferase family 2 protein [Blautia hydrogenotrophica]MEE0463519.1 glycosyltransferase family 2 protein [Blautia hydrogenotrophica]
MRTVTVVVSSFNGEKYIKEQIDSILSQKHCKISLIVRDDGSSDDTIAILHQYEKKGQLKLVQGENLKPAKSFLEALKHSGETDYYAFSDQDDIWLDDKLNVAISALEKMDKKTPNLYCSNLTTINNDYEVINDKLLPEKIVSDYRELLIRSPHIFGCTCVFNSILRNFIVKRELPQRLIMHDLWVALIAASLGNIYYDPSSHIKYRQHGDNHTGAIVSERQKMKGRMDIIKGKTPFLISPQAEEFIQYVGTEELKSVGLLEYTTIVANYRKNIVSKLKYLRTIKHDSMDIRQYLFHVLMILLNRL